MGFVTLCSGDAAGVLTALVTNGEVPWVALPLAVSVGLAAVCAGLVGAELKRLQLARARKRGSESLSEDEQRYRQLFTGGNAGRGMVTLIGLLSVLVVVLIALGIGLLRAGIEGEVAGRTFACLAAATAIASSLIGYWAADEVADVLSALQRRVIRAERRYLALAKAESVAALAHAEELARSINAEYEVRGKAGAKRLEALSFKIMRLNPLVAGHGYEMAPGGNGNGRLQGKSVSRH